MKLLLVLLVMAAHAQSGRFFDGYEAENHGIGINIAIVHDGPRCRELKNCSWAVMWSSKKNAETAEIAVSVAGMDSPVAVAIVPGRRDAKLDAHNPVFEIPLASVSAIDFLLRNGTKTVGWATFK